MSNKVTAQDSIGVFSNTSTPAVNNAFLQPESLGVAPSVAVIGPAPSGPAFVPVAIANPNELSIVFGSVTG